MSRMIVFKRYGGPEILEVKQAPPARLSEGQVRIRVKAAGVQPFDCMFRAGLTHASLPAYFPQRLGNEYSGVVDEIAGRVEWPQVGDEVLGWTSQAAYADHVIVSPDQLVRKPAEMSWGDAGVLSASGQTAATAIEDLNIGPNDILLIHAAAGGVGTFATQLAVHIGATVIGTGSGANHDYLRALGAIPVAYGPGLTDRVRDLAPGNINAALVAIDSAEALMASVDLVQDRSRIGVLPRLPQTVELGLRQIATRRSAERLQGLVQLYSSKDLRIVVQDSFSLENAAEAHRIQETGHVRGKLVLLT